MTLPTTLKQDDYKGLKDKISDNFYYENFQKGENYDFFNIHQTFTNLREKIAHNYNDK
jgi:hypothetical protein